MKVTLLLIALLSITFVIGDKDYFVSSDLGGSQIIDSSLSYANNIRHANTSNKIWFRADKRIPNAYFALASSSKSTDFKITRNSPLNNAANPFVSFDVISLKGEDYIIGPTFGTLQSTKFGLQLQVATADKVNVANTPYCYFYNIVVDQTIQSFDNFYYFYLVGFCFGPSSNKGIVVTRGTVQLYNTLPIAWDANNAYTIDDSCFDVWTETFKPAMFLTNSNTDQFLTISIPGRCSRIVKLKLPPVGSSFAGASIVGNVTSDMLPNGCKLTSSVFDSTTGLLYSTCKNYNSVGSKVLMVNTSASLFKIDKTINTNSPNETTLILAIGPNALYVATQGFNKILKYNKDLTSNLFGVLPPPLKAVASMLVVDNYLYLASSEPNAQFGRMSTNNFCGTFCGDNGYCNGATQQCMCDVGFAKDPLADKFTCAPTHIVQYQNTIIAERGTAAAFGVLFALSIIAAVAGWFMWFRRQNQGQQL